MATHAHHILNWIKSIMAGGWIKTTPDIALYASVTYSNKQMGAWVDVIQVT